MAALVYLGVRQSKIIKWPNEAPGKNTYIFELAKLISCWNLKNVNVFTHLCDTNAGSCYVNILIFLFVNVLFTIITMEVRPLLLGIAPWQTNTATMQPLPTSCALYHAFFLFFSFLQIPQISLSSLSSGEFSVDMVALQLGASIIRTKKKKRSTARQKQQLKYYNMVPVSVFAHPQ